VRKAKVEETASRVLSPAWAAKVRALAKDPAIQAEVQGDVALGASKEIQGRPPC